MWMGGLHFIRLAIAILGANGVAVRDCTLFTGNLVAKISL